MIEGVDHLGIAVKDLDSAMELWSKLLGVQSWHREQVVDQGVDVASCMVGSVRIELTAATRSDSPIAKYIEKRGEGIHHVALRTNTINDDLKTASQQGFRLIDESPRPGAHNMNIAFLHPGSTGGVLIEFCEEGSKQTNH